MINDNKEKREFNTKLKQMTNPRKMEKERAENGNVGTSRYTSKMMLCRETIAKYFYITIKQEAKEVNVGITLLKKFCRDLGIHRWPHRKLMSLETLINNVQVTQNFFFFHKLFSTLQVEVFN